jgi:hypothetical protein
VNDRLDGHGDRFRRRLRRPSDRRTSPPSGSRIWPRRRRPR